MSLRNLDTSGPLGLNREAGEFKPNTPDNRKIGPNKRRRAGRIASAVLATGSLFGFGAPAEAATKRGVFDAIAGGARQTVETANDYGRDNAKLDETIIQITEEAHRLHAELINTTIQEIGGVLQDVSRDFNECSVNFLKKANRAPTPDQRNQAISLNKDCVVLADSAKKLQADINNLAQAEIQIGLSKGPKGHPNLEILAAGATAGLTEGRGGRVDDLGREINAFLRENHARRIDDKINQLYALLKMHRDRIRSAETAVYTLSTVLRTQSRGLTDTLKIHEADGIILSPILDQIYNLITQQEKIFQQTRKNITSLAQGGIEIKLGR